MQVSISQEFISLDHSEIFNKTKHIPGWQEPGDSYKLYEMGYHAGDVILEIGMYGGRSAVVELCGALANQERQSKPQYFGLDIDICGIWRTYDTLEKANLSEHALLYYGGLEQFVQDFSIHPTMVFLDGDHRYEGVRRDLELLAKILSPGVSLLCHDYTNPENDTGELGVRKAITEFVRAGYAELIGTTNQCVWKSGNRLSDQEFAAHRSRLYQTYGKQLYDMWQLSEADRADRLAAIQQLQHQLEQLSTSQPSSNSRSDAEAIENLEKKLKRIRSKLTQLQFELNQTQAKATTLADRIQAMETSKFWMLRQGWFKLKRVLGLKADE
jgi:Methyltransferase domain